MAKTKREMTPSRSAWELKSTAPTKIKKKKKEGLDSKRRKSNESSKNKTRPTCSKSKLTFRTACRPPFRLELHKPSTLVYRSRFSPRWRRHRSRFFKPRRRRCLCRPIRQRRPFLRQLTRRLRPSSRLQSRRPRTRIMERSRPQNSWRPQSRITIRTRTGCRAIRLPCPFLIPSERFKSTWTKTSAMA